MNKVLIRTRQIDNNKQLPILLRDNDDLTDFNEYSSVSKSSQILSGMDKGEESELHLQEVLRELQYEKTTANTAIPIPEVHEKSDYDTLYRTDFICPKNYIRLKTLEFEDECPEYDLDEEDQEWLDNSKLDVTALKFEKIVEEFEKACSQKALLLDEAKSLLRNEKVHIVIAIYDYWLTKRVRTGQPLFLSVKAEKAERCNNTPIDPYIAFRKRSEKMTTRKNRRVDESSYEKMFRLKQHMDKLRETIELVSQREATKSKITEIERDIFMKRFEAREYDKLQMKESELSLKNQSIKLTDSFKSAQRSREENHHKEARRKRPHSSRVTESGQSVAERHWSVDETVADVDDDIDFTFRPMAKCQYLHPRWSRPDIQSRSESNTRTHVIIPPDSHHSWPPLYQLPCVVTNVLRTKLHSLYIRDIHCGLRALSSLSTAATPTTVHQKQHRSSPPPPLVSATSHISVTTSHKYCDSTSPPPPPTNGGGSRYSEIECHNTNCTGLCNQRDDQHNDQCSHTPRNHTTGPGRHNGIICTYQSPLSSPDHNQNHAFTVDSEPPLHTHGQRRSSPQTDIRDMIDAHPNNPSLNGSTYSAAKLSQVVGLNCLKTFTNKRLIQPDDIDEIANFYSKSNGHHPTNYYHNNHHHTTLSNHNHHRPKNNTAICNNNNNGNSTGKWLKQSSTDTCLLRPNTLLPAIWKSEPAHVMTGVNKMA